MTQTILSPYALGATIYCPATYGELHTVMSGRKYPQCRSVVICLEDAVSEHEVQYGLSNLVNVLSIFAQTGLPTQAPYIFIRPRNLDMAKRLATWQHLALICGMVLPKFTLASLQAWKDCVPAYLQIMPTIESVEYFDAGYLQEFRQAMQQEMPSVLTLRVGGNDLLSCLKLRRPKNLTIYQTPLVTLMHQLIGQLVPHGFSLAAPVFEHFSDTALLQQEAQMDVNCGFVSKTAIHPCQIEVIHDAFRVSAHDFADAEKILQQDAKAVFSSHGSMLEPATHQQWAIQTLARAQYYGVSEPEPQYLFGSA